MKKTEKQKWIEMNKEQRKQYFLDYYLFPLGWFLISTETFAAVFWIWVFVGMGIQSFVNSLIIRKIFDRLEAEE